MTYTLSRFGHKMVLTDENNKRERFNSIEDLCKHINRYDLKDKITGLEILPEFYLKMIGKEKTVMDQMRHLTDSIQDSWMHINETIVSSGLTNPKLIE